MKRGGGRKSFSHAEGAGSQKVWGSLQVGEMEIRLFLMGRIMIPMQLCSLPIHSPGICMLGTNE